MAWTYSFEMNKDRRILAKGQVKNQFKPVPEKFFHEILISEYYSDTQYTKVEKMESVLKVEG